MYFSSVAAAVAIMGTSVSHASASALPTSPPVIAKRAVNMASAPPGSGVGGTTCTVTKFNDIPAATASMACSNVLLQGITVPASKTLSVAVPTNGALLFGGTMTVEFTPDKSYTPIVISGNNGKVAGLSGATIDGLGAKYWDGQGSNGGSAKPNHFVKLNSLKNSYFGNLKIRNWPTHLFSISGSNITVGNLLLDNSDGEELGHNTDAFDVSSTTGLHIYNSTIHNQDDCVAVNSGSNMVFEGLYCDGGHGLSIGSIKGGVTVSNVVFKDSSVVNSQNACRIKTIAEATDSTVSNITYSNIAVSNISKYAIDLQQDYLNGGPTGEPTTGILVTGVTFEGITGDVNSKGYQRYVLCGSDTSCTNIKFSGIKLTGGQTMCSPSDVCKNA